MLNFSPIKKELVLNILPFMGTAFKKNSKSNALLNIFLGLKNQEAKKLKMAYRNIPFKQSSFEILYRLTVMSTTDSKNIITY